MSHLRLPRPPRLQPLRLPRQATPGRLARSATPEAPASPAENAPRPRPPLRPPPRPIRAATSQPPSRSSPRSASTPTRSRAKRPRPRPSSTSPFPNRPLLSALQPPPPPRPRQNLSPREALRCFHSLRRPGMNRNPVHLSRNPSPHRPGLKSRSCLPPKQNGRPSVGVMAPTTKTPVRNVTSVPRSARNVAATVAPRNRANRNRFSLATTMVSRRNRASRVSHAAKAVMNRVGLVRATPFLPAPPNPPQPPAVSSDG